ncbi:MAG: hypothetical protein ACE37F_26975 [Nannocystaceae bacterium]|nr:hypothetical protein [bacterium]
MKTTAYLRVWALCGLCACGPHVSKNEEGVGAGEGEAEAGGDDVGSAGFDVEWAMGFYHRSEDLAAGPQLSYLELKPDGTGVWHRIVCDFNPVEPWAFQWRALSDSEVELYPVEGEERFPTLVSLRESELLRRKTPDGSEALTDSGVVGADPVTYETGRPCNVPPPKEGCPMPGWGPLDEIPICDQR